MPPRPAPTHFLCIPLAGSQLARSLASFRADITSPSPAGFDVPEQAVRPPGTLHLTLGVMTLRDDDGSLARAVDLLRCLRLRDVLEQARTATATAAAAAAGARAVAPRTTTRPPAAGERLSVTLQGLQAMQRPSETSVLYAPPADPTGVLRRFCESLRRVFQEAGLMAEEQRPLLLHATVVNTVYVRGQRRQQQQQRGRGSSSNNNGRQNGGGRRERMTIDARDIIARYDDYVWVEDMPVGKVAICRMGARRIEGTDGDEAYEVEAQVSIRGS